MSVDDCHQEFSFSNKCDDENVEPPRRQRHDLVEARSDFDKSLDEYTALSFARVGEALVQAQTRARESDERAGRCERYEISTMKTHTYLRSKQITSHSVGVINQ